ncbi:M28 family peptidase [Planctomycetales bacterium ZRK34]|nr:M28 family peptidase [Planctomycetales bacterium ZRK34]
MVLLTGVLHVQAADSANQPSFVSNVRQLTFAGLRSGEGYFSADGTMMIFQSERDADNPFYQIYLMDLETGDTERLSPGVGKTTCAWIAPGNKKALYASTHEDPNAKKKQKLELDDRAAGRQKRYAWDYDEHYDIYAHNLQTGQRTNLTNTLGYDAEGSYSPDGKRIAFASNRLAYIQPMTDEQKEHFEQDPAYMMDIYIMDADGSNVKRLTETPGYDGGPFFSPDGQRICWRRFSPDGATAEIYTMNIDGSDQRRLTHMNAMSWAPYFHPSGKYLVFTTNKHGFANFELYLVDADGKHEPVRATDRAGFDGLPVFSPDGAKLAWTSNATPAKHSQIFIGQWDHQAALKALGLDETSPTQATAVADTAHAINIDDLRLHVGHLAADAMDGRLTGTPGEQQATKYVKTYFQRAGLKPAGADGKYFDPFEFTAGVSLGSNNTLTMGDKTYAVDKDWRPLAFSMNGKIDPASVAFAGYGIVAPAGDDVEEYDSYVHMDVKGKWVIVLRYVPENVDDKMRQHLRRHAALRFKAMVARDHGAAGIIVVSGPQSKVNQQLVELSFDTSLAGTSIGAISVTDDLAAAWLKAAGKDLSALQKKLDAGDMVMGFDLPDQKLAATVDMRMEKRTGRNVIGRLTAGDEPSDEAVVIGAHVDHLGHGEGSSSLAGADEKGQIHHGADDNASGVAALLEIAEYLSDLKQRGKLKMSRDVIFAAWSGEELGLLGSSHYVSARRNAEGRLPGVVAYLNMDMIGRYEDKLIVQGVGSSSGWATLIEQANVPVGLKIKTSQDAYLPTDTTPFYAARVPVLSAFTGAHGDYHRPSDTADKINYEAHQKITRFMALITRHLAKDDSTPDYLVQKRPDEKAPRGGMRAYLGTIPDYAQTDVKGVKLTGVSGGGPAEQAGLKGGDIIVSLNDKKIENIYDYTYAIEDLKIGQETPITVQRGEEQIQLKIIPRSRD